MAHALSIYLLYIQLVLDKIGGYRGRKLYLNISSHCNPEIVCHFPSDITLIVAAIVTRKDATRRPEDPVLNLCRYKELLILTLAPALLGKAQKQLVLRISDREDSTVLKSH